ncbi:MAG: hypothetical protein ACHQT5_01735 [Candidatus Saccharimonadales bacterium]|jgi:hypothetical protein
MEILSSAYAALADRNGNQAAMLELINARLERERVAASAAGESLAQAEIEIQPTQHQ